MCVYKTNDFHALTSVSVMYVVGMDASARRMLWPFNTQGSSRCAGPVLDTRNTWSFHSPDPLMLQKR